MNTKSKGRRTHLSAGAKRCLATILAAELGDNPIEAQTWRAQNARRIKYVNELLKARMLEFRDNTHYVVRLYGLMNAPGEVAESTLSKCERLFKLLAQHYRRSPKVPIPIVEITKRLKFPPREVEHLAHFLARSPAYLGLFLTNSPPALQPNENYVAWGGFQELRSKAVDEAHQAEKFIAGLSLDTPPITGGAIAWDLTNCECEAVGEYFGKAIERLTHDTEGAITLARSMLEAGCKYVLEEFRINIEKNMDLPRLYREAARCLELDPHRDLDEVLRSILQGGVAIVCGLAHLRNRAGDAHGRGHGAPKPARRHAEFAVMMATAVTSLLLRTLDAQRALK